MEIVMLEQLAELQGAEVIPVLAVIICLFGWPIINLLLRHRKEMTELKLKARTGGDEALIAELRALKEQVSDLRDTTTRYDVSFDTALQRLESRMGLIENRMGQVEAQATDRQTISG